MILIYDSDNIKNSDRNGYSNLNGLTYRVHNENYLDYYNILFNITIFVSFLIIIFITIIGLYLLYIIREYLTIINLILLTFYTIITLNTLILNNIIII